MAKRKKVIKHEDYFRLDMHDCYRWCLHNGIKIYPIASTDSEQFIEINNNGAIIRSPKAYTKVEIYKKMWELYCHYYDNK